MGSSLCYAGVPEDGTNDTKRNKPHVTGGEEARKTFKNDPTVCTIAESGNDTLERGGVENPTRCT